jgi:hypothetical protein
MTSYTIREACNLLLRLFEMAAQAPAHVHRAHWAHLLHASNRSVASLTIHSGINMGHMTEENVIGDIVHCIPGDRFASLPIFEHVLNLRGIFRNCLVTTHTELDRRDTSDVGAEGMGMAVKTVNASVIVDTMAEGDGLCWRGQRSNSAYSDGRQNQDHE